MTGADGKKKIVTYHGYYHLSCGNGHYDAEYALTQKFHRDYICIVEPTLIKRKTKTDFEVFFGSWSVSAKTTKKTMPVFKKKGKQKKRVLLRGKKDRHAFLIICPPIVLRLQYGKSTGTLSGASEKEDGVVSPGVPPPLSSKAGKGGSTPERGYCFFEAARDAGIKDLGDVESWTPFVSVGTMLGLAGKTWARDVTFRKVGKAGNADLVQQDRLRNLILYAAMESKTMMVSTLGGRHCIAIRGGFIYDGQNAYQLNDKHFSKVVRGTTAAYIVEKKKGKKRKRAPAAGVFFGPFVKVVHEE